jgi:peptidoglycan/xylan/chitin deacetylase (PgdA/CDA1 family)
MKAVMYHYVREADASLPYFRHLEAADFRQQLDWFAANLGFVTRHGFAESLRTGIPRPGVILTFDDGFADHHDYVMPELVRRGLWGFFYVPTGILGASKPLDVHRIHLLLGARGGSLVAARLRELVQEEHLRHGRVEEFKTATYSRQENDEATLQVKRILNYFCSEDAREVLLDQLTAEFVGDEAVAARKLYMSERQLVAMRDNGMVIGSHTHSHPVLSKLCRATQEAEIQASFAALESVLGPLPDRPFCYPYGGFHSFNSTTEELLAAAGCRHAFNVEPRDISQADLSGRPLALPRYDCNQFPHGACRR